MMLKPFVGVKPPDGLLTRDYLRRDSGLLVPRSREIEKPGIWLPSDAPHDELHAFTVTNQGTASTSSASTLSVGPFDPGANSFVAALIYEVNPTNLVSLGLVSDGSNSYGLGVAVPAGGSQDYSFGYRYQFYTSDPGSITVTYTVDQSSSSVVMSVFSVLGTNGAFDLPDLVQNTNSGTSTSPSVGSGGAPQGSGYLYFGGIAWKSGVTTISGVNFTPPPNAISAVTLNIAGGNLVNSGVGTETLSGTLSSSNLWLAFIDAIGPGAASGGPSLVYAAQKLTIPLGITISAT